MASSILQNQYEAWKQRKQSTTAHAWKALDESSGLWYSPSETISPSDKRMEQGKVVDLLACERATDQPRQFFATSLDALVELLPALIQGAMTGTQLCTLVHEVWMERNAHEKDSKPHLFVPCEELDPAEQQKDFDFVFL